MKSRLKNNSQLVKMVARLVFFRQDFRHLALFQVGWSEKFHLAFSSFSCLVSSWLALKISLGLLAFLR